MNTLRPLPFSFAKRHGVLLTGEAGECIYRDRLSIELLGELVRFAGPDLRPRRVGAEEFDRALRMHYEGGAGQASAVIEDLGRNVDLNRIAEDLPEQEDLLENADDAPVIRLINALLAEAIKDNASDIHIEPFEDRVRVRFRVDGVLRDVLNPRRAIGPLLVSRVKIMAKLDIAEKRLPQDGRISLQLAGRRVDARVSTIPGAHGERVVLRLLDKQAGRLDLEQLGMPAGVREAVERIIRAPHGIFLVTGPTGSGKTTTLYAALGGINDARRNIMTVEDPIEYHIDGIAQTQVNAKVDMSFARGLRAILRQDPDVVMVGEIRDLETAQIAVQASLTGHLVLSTLHTNSAVGAVTRLRDMGVQPYLLASSIAGALAQRLVRALCPECRAPVEPDEAERALLGVAPDERVVIFRPQGCDQCRHTGYRGRTGLYELLIADDRVRTLIHGEGGEKAIAAHAVAQGMTTLREEARRAVLAGVTSIEEMIRVTEER